MFKALFDLDEKLYLFSLLLIKKKKKNYLQHLSNPQNTSPSFLLLPIEDLQVIGFSFVSIATLAPALFIAESPPLPCLGTAQRYQLLLQSWPMPIIIHSP